MFASDHVLTLLKRFEGCSLTPYRDAAGYWTVGYGHKLKLGEIPVTISREQAEDMLFEDLGPIEAAVERLLIDCPVTQNQIDALVSFTFNVGADAFANSQLREHVIKGDIAGAADEFPRWDHIHGTPNMGLAHRRRVERELFLTPDQET